VPDFSVPEIFFALLQLRNAPLAQLDRASGYEPEGREFESLRAHHLLNSLRESKRERLPLM
jgi:hypothetical protein